MKIRVGSKDITIQKWKGKNKKDFIKLLKETDDSIECEEKMMDILVYSCIEEDVILSTEEFRYVLSRIRALSLGEEIEIEFYCDKCQEIFKQTFNIKDVINFSYKPLKEIKIPGAKIKLGEIKNKKIYTEKIAEDPVYDFLLRIESINGNTTFNLTELEEIVDSMDLDVYENVMSIYKEHKFKILDVNTVKCNCGNEMLFKFDELPGFFPDSWFDED